MKIIKINCDKCKKELKRSEYIEVSFDNFTGMGHNGLPYNGWQFCYDCVGSVVAKVKELLSET